ncbi:MAG: histone H1-like repetitive region-containing protein [Pseudomonadota bacterium]
MGKDSLLKSTAKEKTGSKKAGGKKKNAPAKKNVSPKKTAATNKTAPGKKAAPEQAPVKKAAPQQAPAKKPASQQAPANKADVKKTTAKASPPAIKDLLALSFDAWSTQARPAPKVPSAPSKGSAPPFFSGVDAAEAARMGKLLLEKFDMTAIEAAGRAYAKKMAAAEKAAAEKAAAEKAAAEKAAAEKAAAEKAAAEKAAAEKAAAEKAAAEKAAAEKAAAEKAAAEKAAAEKAAAEKAAAEKVTVTYESAYEKPGKAAAPVDRSGQIMMGGIIGVIGLVFLMLIGASISNTGKYYITPGDGALTIYQGKFAPLGKKHLITLPGMELAAELRPVYAKTDVYPLIFSHYLGKADALLLNTGGFPDFDGIKGYLDKALAYAANNDAKNAVYRRIDGIDLLLYLYKADVAASRGTLADYQQALSHLNSAASLNPDASQVDLIAQKKAAIEATIADLEAAATEKAAAEEAAAAEAAAADKNTDETKAK